MAAGPSQVAHPMREEICIDGRNQTMSLIALKTIKKEAKICRFCNMDLDKGRPMQKQ